MKKIYSLILFIYVSTTLSYAQEVRYRDYQGNGNYANSDSIFRPEGIASDFGPRKIDDNWHGGLDYNSPGDMWDMLMAPEGGTIVNVNHVIVNSNIRYIALDAGDHRYLFVHMFDNDNSVPRWMNNNTIYLTRLLGNQNQNTWALVLIMNGDTTVVGQREGILLMNGDTLNVSNSITQYSPIGPLGNSGGSNVPAHLHLNTIPDNQSSYSDIYNRNPLQYVDYVEPTYSISLTNPGSSGFSMTYPGTQLTKIMAKTTMNDQQDNTVQLSKMNDLNKVELLLKKVYESTYQRIKGTTKETIISLGGRLNEQLINHTQGSIGNQNLQGIDSYMHHSAAPHPYDDYYFPNLIPRLHRDTNLTAGALSYCPMSSRYNDGRYQLKARITDVRNNATDGSVQEFVIDNYKPFIQEVKVNLPNVAEPFYQRYWVCNDNVDCRGMYLTTPGTTNNEVALALIRNGMWITVTASEPLANLTLDIADSNIQDVQAYDSFEDGRKWQFVLNSQQMSTILGKQSIEFLFYGYDWNNPANHLINLKTADGAETCVRIPKRTGADSWEHDRTTGPDELHFFNPKCGQHGRSVNEEEPIVVIIPDESCFNYGEGVTWEVSTATNETATDGAILLHVEGGIEPYRYGLEVAAGSVYLFSGRCP